MREALPSKRTASGLSSEAFIGAFVLFGFAFLAGFVIWFKNISFSPQQRFIVSFPDVEGLKANAPVTADGVRVGTIDRVDLVGVHKVLVTVRMDPHALPVKRGARFNIESFGLIGAKYLDIELPEETAGTRLPLLTEKTIVAGEEPVVLEKVMDRIGKGLNSLDLENDSVAFERTLQKLEKLEDNMYVTSNKFGALAQNASGTARKVNNALASTDLKETLNNLHEASGNLNKAAVQTNQMLDRKHPLLHMIFGRPGHIKDPKDSKS
jgi:phospholipid/cholesterol/gamma-HCH transport system substrate-binding protein